MATQPRSTKPTSKKHLAHYTAILLEDMKSQFKVAIEHIDTVATSLNSRFDRLERESDARFHIIELILKQHSELLQKNEERWKQNEERWIQNDERWKQNEARWIQNEERWLQNEKRWFHAESMLTHLIKGLDAVMDRLERHDHDIDTLRN